MLLPLIYLSLNYQDVIGQGEWTSLFLWAWEAFLTFCLYPTGGSELWLQQRFCDKLYCYKGARKIVLNFGQPFWNGLIKERKDAWRSRNNHSIHCEPNGPLTVGGFSCLAVLEPVPCLKGKCLRANQGCLNTLRFCGYNYIGGSQHNHLWGQGEQTRYVNVFLFFITNHHTPTISVGHEVPSRNPSCEFRTNQWCGPSNLSLTLTSIWGNGPREFSATLIGGITQSLFCLRRPLELFRRDPENMMTGGGAWNASFLSFLSATFPSSFVTFKTTQGFI